MDLFSLLLIVACTGENTNNSTEGLTAAAGENQQVLLSEEAILDGSSSSGPQGQQLLFHWSFRAVPELSLLDKASFGPLNSTSSAITASFEPDRAGAYVVSLVISDGSQQSLEDLVVIDVTSDNGLPDADAGADQNGAIDTLVLLDGQNSVDPEDQVLSYEWSLAGQPAESDLSNLNIFDRTSAQASFIPDADGTFVFSLTVADPHDFSEPDFVIISIASDNDAPVANAGSSETMPPCDGQSIALNGLGSYDPDGEALSYTWEISSLPEGSTASADNFDDSTSPTANFEWDVVGDYTFTLQVYDGTFFSAMDIVTITTLDPSANIEPVAFAGNNQSTEVDTTCILSSGSWTCEPCPPIVFAVDGSGSTDDNGDSLSYLWWHPEETAVISDPTLAVTTVSTPSVEAVKDEYTVEQWTLSFATADCSVYDVDTVKLTVSCLGTGK